MSKELKKIETMKNLNVKLSYALYALLVAFLIVGCNRPDKYELKHENGINYKVIEIEGCEYIWYKDRSQYGQTMSHKGNCKNEIHAYNQCLQISNKN